MKKTSLHYSVFETKTDLLDFSVRFFKKFVKSLQHASIHWIYPEQKTSNENIPSCINAGSNPNPTGFLITFRGTDD